MVGLRNGVRVVEAREENGELVGMSLLVRVEEGEGGIGMRQVWARAFALAMEEDGTLEEVIAAGDGVRVRVELKYVLFSLTAPKEKAGGCLAGWGEGVRKPAFTERMVEEAKRESLAGLKAREEDWTGQALMYLGATYNEGRSLHSLEEMEEATKEISLEGVREFHRRLVVPERLVVGIVGESGAEEGIRAAKEAFEGIEGDEGGARKEGGGSPFPWGLGETVAVEENGAGAAYVVLGYSVEGAKDEEWVGLELMGILMRREIEERRLVGREVYGGVTTVPLGIGLSREGLGGTLVVYGVCHPLRMGEAANFMEEWVERWRSMEIGEDELEKAREELRYMTTMRWQSAGMMAEYWGSRGIMASCGRGEIRRG